MEIRNSFCVNYYKALTIRFVRELQSVLRFLYSFHNQAILALISFSLFLYIIMYLDYLLIIFVKLLLVLVE